jgi:phosphopantothenoylcysteine decarboxylase/phosphopantothenate--cysteine ligase
MKILVTAGATREPIDAVRFLSNVSTGRTGATLAEAFAQRGHAVTLLRGEGAATPKEIHEVKSFSSAADLRMQLERCLATENFDAVVMTAAVADYRPTEMAQGKISSEAAALTLHLVRNEKILPRLKSFARRPLRVVGFKLTVAADASARREAVAAQFDIGGVDCVVHNDLAEIRAAATHPFWLWRASGATPERLEGTAALAAALEPLLAPPS